MPDSEEGEVHSNSIANDEQVSETTVSRRSVLGTLGIASGITLAGCPSGNNSGDGSAGDGGGDGGGGDGGGDGGDGDGGGDGGGDETELGEPVETVGVEFWVNFPPYSDFQEAALPIIRNNVEQLGISVETESREVTSSVGDLFNDARSNHTVMMGWSQEPSRLDPFRTMNSASLNWAGANGFGNGTQYANCEVTKLIQQSNSAASVEERREMVDEAQQIMAEDHMMTNLVNTLRFSIYRTDQVEANGTGRSGLVPVAPYGFISSRATGDNPIIASVDPSATNTKTYPAINNGETLPPWSQLFGSPLIAYDENYELRNVLAEDIRIEDEFKRVVVDIREDAVFHNGDPVLAEDVAWTFQWLSNNASSFQEASAIEYESINELDDHTVEFNLAESTPPLIDRTFTLWGILHKDIWIEGGAEETPTDVDYELVGSGPYEITQFDQGRFIRMEPFEDHPVFNPNSELFFQAYESAQSALQAFLGGDINVQPNIPPAFIDRAESEMGDRVEVLTAEGFLPERMAPQHSFGPFMHKAFRKAWSYAINRQAVNEAYYGGRSQPVNNNAIFPESHPWQADDLEPAFTDPSGDVEAARAVLEEAGFGWDDEGNLHYPPDADLSPAWPKGSEPLEQPDKYPCVEDGELVFE